MKYFMLDIETMGTDFENDDIIQIGLLEINKESNGTYVPGAAFSLNLHTDQEPKSDWIANTHRELLKKCRKAPKRSPEVVRGLIKSFFRQCGVIEPAMLMGLNATTFDVPYMVHKGYLSKPYQDANNVLQGDYHYRVYELTGGFNLAQDALGMDSKTFRSAAERACAEVELPPGQAHTALFDCYRQLKQLNGAIRLIQQG